MVRVPRNGSGQAKSSAPEEQQVADPVDVHVGRRLRQRRALLGLSQERLGRAVGLTFQQIQKYERGANRVGASRLLQLSQALAVPIGYFFEDAPTTGKSPAAKGRIAKADKLKFSARKTSTASKLRVTIQDPFSRRETLELVRAYYAIGNPQVRRRVLELVRALSKTAPG